MSSILIYNKILEDLEEYSSEQGDAVGISEAVLNNLLLLDPNNWGELIPKIDDTGLPSDSPTTSTGVFCVWDNVYNRCQSSCTWTVPAGVTRAGFQLWGGGGGSSSGCCCGGHPGGSTGEFVSIIMDVSPGETYTIQNTCNYCCLGYRGGIQLSAGYAQVSGPGITSLCAAGGCGTLCSWSCSGRFGLGFGFDPTIGKYISHKEGSNYSNNGQYGCRWMNPASTSPYGSCFCNSGYDYCFTNSCETAGTIPWMASHCTQTATTIDEARNPVCGWIPRRWNAMCYDTNHYGWLCYAPTVCFGASGATTAMHPGSNYCQGYTSGTCCGSNCSTAVQGGIAGAAFGCMPGHGAVFSHAMGGNNSVCGDTGRGAAVRVSFC